MQRPLPGCPRLRCRHASFGPVRADPGVAPWGGIAPAFLLDTVTGCAPLQRTWFKTAWNGEELRALFRVEDTSPNAAMTARDAPLYEEEVVEFFLDPAGDLASYYEIEVNPLNAVLDLVLRRTRNGYRKDFGWRCENLVTAVRREPGVWLAEMAIPMSSIVPEPPRNGDLWRANFHRIDRAAGRARRVLRVVPDRQAAFPCAATVRDLGIRDVDIPSGEHPPPGNRPLLSPPSLASRARLSPWTLSPAPRARRPRPLVPKLPVWECPTLRNSVPSSKRWQYSQTACFHHALRFHRAQRSRAASGQSGNWNEKPCSNNRPGRTRRLFKMSSVSVRRKNARLRR